MALTEEQKQGVLNSLTKTAKPGEIGYEKYFGSSKQGVIRETLGDIGGIGTDIVQAGKDRGQKLFESQEGMRKGEQGAIRTIFQSIGQTAGLASDIVGSAVKGIGKAFLPQRGEEAVGRGVQAVGETISKMEPVQAVAQGYERLKQENPALARDISAALGVGELALDAVLGGVASRVAKPIARAGSEAVETVVEQAPKVARETAEKVSQAITPVKTVDEAVEQVLQVRASGTKAPAKIARATDRAKKAFAEIDTTGVQTFDDLNNVMQSKIDELKSVKEQNLASNPNVYKLNTLATTVKTRGGSSLKTNYVDNALKHLEEVYRKTGDIEKLGNIKEAIKQARTKGLTALELDELAQIYGREFGEKAFDGMGNPLTSVNAKMFENVRKGIKNVSRSKMTDDIARSADESMSALINTQQYIQKQIGDLSKLQAKIQERGLVEKLGYVVTKALDIVSAGGLRGVVGGLLPRGAGYKVMNAIDLEEALAKNLEVIQKALKSTTDAQLESAVKELDALLPAVTPDQSSTGVQPFYDTGNPRSSVGQQMPTGPINKLDGIQSEKLRKEMQQRYKSAGVRTR
jgi:hypothetical protein